MSITLADVKRAVVDSLRERMPGVEVYSEDTVEGFERSSRAALFAEVLPAEIVNMEFLRQFTATVRVSYHPEADQAGMSAEMYGELARVFAESLVVGEDTLNISTSRGDSDEGARLEGPLQYTFDVSWSTPADNVIMVGRHMVKLNPRLGYTEESLRTMQELVLRKE